jgi:hypothetical protein
LNIICITFSDLLQLRITRHKGIDPADIDALNQKFRQQRAQIENALLAGLEILNQVRADIISKQQLFKVEVETAAQSIAQSRSDMSVFR